MAQESENQNCVFCLIASEKIAGYKISEIPEAVAVLEINPVSKGHAMVLPKEHLQLKEMKSKIVLFAQKLASQLKEKLASKDIEISTVDFQGHGIINLIPVYNDENISSERYKASPQELEGVQNLFFKEDENKNQKVEKSEDKKNSEKEDIIEKKGVDENPKNSQEKSEVEDNPKEPEQEKSIWFPRRIP